MSDSTVNRLEYLLRQHKTKLCAEAAERYMRLPKSDSLGEHKADWSTIGAEFTHDLVAVAAALYPSEITLRDQLRWVSTGVLRQHGIGYDHHVAMLQGYFSAARRVLKSAPGLDILEAFISRILVETFLADPLA